MKQLAFMVVTTLIGAGGSFVLSPVYGITVYYMYAVLRPQFIWEWSLPVDLPWSFYVASATLVATAVWRLGVFAPAHAAAPPWYGNPKFTRTHYLFLAFTAWISLTYATAVNQLVAWPFFVEYVKIFVMFLCATFVLRTVRELWVIYFTVLGCAVYIGYEINFYYFAYQYLILQQRGYGGLDNNGAALILAMAVPMCFFAWEGTSGRIRWAFLAVVPVLIHAVLLSYSRGAMLSLVVIAPVMWLRTRHKWLVTGVFLALGAVTVVMAGKEIRERFFSIGGQEADGGSQKAANDSAQSRLTTWKIGATMATERPLFGFGIRNSSLFTHGYGADMPGRVIHSQYLQVAADSGWVALALYLLMLGSLFLGVREVRKFLRQYTDPETLRVRSMASGLECALLLFCFGAVFLSLEHFEMPYIIMLLAVQLHAITRAVKAKLPPAPHRPMVTP